MLAIFLVVAGLGSMVAALGYMICFENVTGIHPNALLKEKSPRSRFVWTLYIAGVLMFIGAFVVQSYE